MQGDPGSGKTTLGLQFLIEGQRRGEKGIYISLSETREEIESVAKSHGWSLDGLDLLEATAGEQQLVLNDEENTLFEPSEVELRELVQRLSRKSSAPTPAGWCSIRCRRCACSSQSALRYRRHVLVFKQFFPGGLTVLLLDDRTTADDDRQLQSLAHGVLALESTPSDFGSDRRRVRVVKCAA